MVYDQRHKAVTGITEVAMTDAAVEPVDVGEKGLIVPPDDER